MCQHHKRKEHPLGARNAASALLMRCAWPGASSQPGASSRLAAAARRCARRLGTLNSAAGSSTVGSMGAVHSQQQQLSSLNEGAHLILPQHSVMPYERKNSQPNSEMARSTTAGDCAGAGGEKMCR